jgi:hypothetical protein
MLNELLKELVNRAGGPTRVARELRERGMKITQTAISNYTTDPHMRGHRTPTNSMVAALLDIGRATKEEAAAVWMAAGVPAADLRESVEGATP